MRRLLKSQDYLMKCLGFVLLFGFISLGAIGGCNNSGNGGNPGLVVLGAHRDFALNGISSVILTTPHLGEPNNILLDGVMIGDLSEEEIELIREAYDAGFVIVFYEVSEKDIIQIYRDIIDHPITHDELENLENILEGDMSPIFTIERHGNVDWTSTGDLNMGEVSELPEGVEDDRIFPDQGEEFAVHGRIIRDWLEDHPSRKQQVISENLNTTNVQRLVDDLDLRDELDEELGIDTRTETGTLLDLANANIHTSVMYVSFHETTNKNTYVMTSKAWIVTADTPNGIFAFLLVRQDFNLANSNGFVVNKEGSKALSSTNPQQYWYLKEYKVKNTYQVGSTLLNINKAELLEESPATNQSSTQSSTTSLTTSISGRVAADTGSSGPTANVAIQGGVSWGTSTTVSKENVSINNLSLSDNEVSNDATWQFLPRRPEAGGQKGACTNFGLRNLADLAHTTFQPATAFIVRIDDDFVGQTLKIKTTFTIQLENSYIHKCNLFGCSCSVARQTLYDGPWTPGTTHSVRIPYPPEGPAGDSTCSDGLDNDSDGVIDSDDPSCQS